VAEGVAARFAYAVAGIVVKAVEGRYLRIRVTPGTRSKQQQYQKQRISYYWGGYQTREEGIYYYYYYYYYYYDYS
jgi:hypothetical protein